LVARILVVDWVEEDRVYLWSVLEDAGHDLFFAVDGQTALEVWEKQDIDLIVTELDLPQLNGLRLIKELKRRDRWGLIVAISDVSADQLDLAEDYGASRVLYKPVSPEQLLEAVDQVLAGRRFIRRYDWM
jgi:CheY-like chemotaxis protein